VRGVLLREVGVVEMVDLEEPEAGPGEVVVDVAVAGICGSDVHAARDGGLLRTPPIVMGHEFSGTVDGRRVAVNPMISCGVCDGCERGQPHLCRNRSIIGIQRPGALAAKVAVPLSSLFDFPDDVSMEAGAMIEPLAVAYHALELCRPTASDRVGILGSGTIGLLIAFLCTSLSNDISIADPHPQRIGFAESLGVGTTGDLLEGEFDIIFDAVGSPTSHRLSLEHLRPGGTTVWVGNESPEAGIDAQMLVRIEHQIIGSAAYAPDDFSAAAALIDDRVLGWATVRDLEDGPEVIYGLMKPTLEGGPVKVLFRP
jgi:alcohol dehydrogenase